LSEHGCRRTFLLLASLCTCLPPYDEKVAVGAWYYTGTFNDLSETAANGAPKSGGRSPAHLLLDRLLALVDQRRITGFVQLGVADRAVDRFGMYIGTGLAVTGLLPGRPNDQAGIAANRDRAHLSGADPRIANATVVQLCFAMTY
jgi:carbohydrate-selective porin OprB